jgi:hypothetical protein
MFIDFNGSIPVDHAIFSADAIPANLGTAIGIILANRDYSVAGFTTAPDGGSNLLLLGSALSALGLARRKFLS